MKNENTCQLNNSSLLTKALKYAKQGDKARASELIEEVERRSNPHSDNEAQGRLINELRTRFNLKHLVKTTVGQLIPDPVVSSLHGVSLVTCCKNRTENLIKALPTWLAHERITEIIIVDWSSDIEVAVSLRQAGIIDSRIRIVRAEKEPRWILSYAFNLGFRLARYELVLKVDADITLKPDFFQRNHLKSNIYIAGNWEAAAKGQEHINGFFFIYRAALLKINGFNEYITTYGWDDDDIYSRLIQSGLQRVCVDTNSIYHIPHDDVQRLGTLAESEDNAYCQLRRDTLFKIRSNRYIAMVMPPWNSDRLFVPFEIHQEIPGYVRVQRCHGHNPHWVNTDIQSDAEYHAALEIVSWRIGPDVYHLKRLSFENLLRLKRLEQISKYDIDVALSESDAILSMKRHSLHIELVGVKQDQLLEFFCNLLLSRLANLNISMFVGGGTSQQREHFVSLMCGRAMRLDHWVRSEALTRLTTEELLASPELAIKGSGVCISLSDLLLLKIAGNRPFGEEVVNVGIRSTERRQRLYIHAQHGLGNRLRAFASAAAVAKATDRELILVWVPDHHCECRFTDLFKYDGIVIEDTMQVDTAALQCVSYMELDSGSMKDQPILLNEGHDILIRSAYVLNHPASSWSVENEVLQNLKPVDYINNLVDSVDVINCIGVHVRMEAGKGLDNNSYDSVENWNTESHNQIHYWREKSHYSVFMHRIDQLLVDKPELQIFLATDLPENYNAFQQCYGSRLHYLQRDCFDRSREQIMFALADALLLSRCTRLLGSTWSSFSELAMRLSTSYSKIEMSGKDF